MKVKIILFQYIFLQMSQPPELSMFAPSFCVGISVVLRLVQVAGALHLVQTKPRRQSYLNMV